MARRGRKHRDTAEIKNLLRDVGARIERNKETRERVKENIERTQDRLREMSQEGREMPPEQCERVARSIEQELEDLRKKQGELDEEREQLLAEGEELLADLEHGLDQSKEDAKKVEQLAGGVQGSRVRAAVAQVVRCSRLQIRSFERLVSNARRIITASAQ